MSQLTLAKVGKQFGRTRVIHELDLEVRSGEFVVLVGPSGCGKSTVLRMIAGLEELTAGQIKLDDRLVNHLTPPERGVAMVFQNYALYPHMTVRQNMSFGLRLSGMESAETERRVNEAARVLNLSDYLDKKPGQLSGGQKQRVAMGRAMVRRPKLFLFDEPLSNLDAALRVRMRAEIAHLHRQLGCTTIYVTHDQVEAMTLADRIAVVNGGKIEQYGPPLELYHKPLTKFVAAFLGMPPMNFLPVALLPAATPPHGTIEFGIRAEDLLVSDRPLNSGGTQNPGIVLTGGKIRLIEPLGSLTHIHVELPGSENPVVAEVRDRDLPKTGESVTLIANPERLYFFDHNGKALTR